MKRLLIAMLAVAVTTTVIAAPIVVKSPPGGIHRMDPTGCPAC